MDYVEVNVAKDLSGLRLALTKNVPAPWSQSAKYVFEYKGIDFVPVAQIGAAPNDDLYAWTGHRNAPVAVYNDEPPRAAWFDILMLAERLAPTPTLIPKSVAERAHMFGLIVEIASESGLAWQRRLQLIDVIYQSGNEQRRQAADVLAARYGYHEGHREASIARTCAILDFLRETLAEQKAKGRRYLIGDRFTAADLYFACFSQLLEPMPPALNPMSEDRHHAYATLDQRVKDAVDPTLIAHRDFIYTNHLSLPLDF